MAVRVVTAVADADGVELISSDPPSRFDAGTVTLDMALEGDAESVSTALAMLRDDLRGAASIELADG
jgi:hypothetical protein